MFDVRAQGACAQVLLPILLREQVHIQQAGLVQRQREVEYRVLCGTSMHEL
jgi:hypothetical protein